INFSRNTSVSSLEPS
ncbi:hypothetical protein E4281_12760, partial [Staphylococcus pseudintermedius]|nr:hypothetical protein [Staphylococcus pseudintermedius]